jgi:MHS family proline/betaine transporter-like MFS transporter
MSDHYGRHKVMGIALTLIAVTTYPLFVLLTTWPTIATLMFVQALVGLLLAACLGPVPALLADIFPTKTRGTGLALSYNFSVTIFGGFAPLIVTFLIEKLHNKVAPSFYVMATAVISITALIMLAKKMKTSRFSMQATSAV